MIKVLLVGECKDVTGLKKQLDKMFVEHGGTDLITCTNKSEDVNYKYVVYTGKFADVQYAMINRLNRMLEIGAQDTTLTMYYSIGAALRSFKTPKEVRDYKADNTCKWIEHFNDEELRTELIQWLGQYAIVEGMKDCTGIDVYKLCCNPAYYERLQAKVRDTLRDTDMDCYNAGHVVRVQKPHTFTCKDDHNEYLNRGETSVHTENRGKDVYETSFLEDLKNYCTLKWCEMLGIDTDDNKGRSSQVASNYEKMILGLDF